MEGGLLILELLSDERLTYMAFIGMLLGFDLLILYRVVREDKR